MISPWQSRGALLGLAFGFALSGCATDVDKGIADDAPSAPATHITAVPAVGPVISAIEPPQTVPELKPEPEPLLPVPDPPSLVGYDEAALEALFGKPSFMRRDPPAELWQYRNDSCTLDLFLYENAAGNYTVEHLEFRETAISTEAAEHCFRAIIEQKLAAAAST
ncbi:MAG: hypothetical protein H8E30_01540 [Alphaproteobacteria bacterium]|nr:hypothetical protein [Alphaproteobacteria bacterium]